MTEDDVLVSNVDLHSNKLPAKSLQSIRIKKNINNWEMSICQCVSVYSIVMNHGQIHLLEQSHTKKKNQVKHVWVNMCPWCPAGSVQDWTRTLWFHGHVSMWGPSWTPSSVPQVKGSNWGQTNLMSTGPDLSHTHQFTRISPGSWRACWSSWASEPLWRKRS